MSRLPWDDYFMKMAELVSERSTCLRRKVGAVIVSEDNRVLSTGYNGAPVGLENCCDKGECIRQKLNIPSGERHELCRSVHAEQNAIIQCALTGVSCKGATIYITLSPCNMCLKQVINAGIKKIIAKESYPDKLSMAKMKESGI